MSVVRTALFEGQIQPPSLESYGLSQGLNQYDTTLPLTNAGQGISGYGGVTFLAIKYPYQNGANPSRYIAAHRCVKFTLREIYGDKAVEDGKYTFLFQVRCTGAIKQGYNLFLFENTPSGFSVIDAPYIDDTDEFVDCMLVIDRKNNYYQMTSKTTSTGRLPLDTSYFTLDTPIYMLHPKLYVTDNNIIQTNFPYQVSARDFVFIADDGIGISDVQSQFSGLYRYEFASVSNEGMSAEGGFIEQAISKPIRADSYPVLRTIPGAPSHSFTADVATNLSNSIRVDGIGCQITLERSDSEMGTVGVTVTVSDDVGTIGTIGKNWEPGPDTKIYQMHIGFLDLIQSGIKIKPNRVSKIKFKVDISGNMQSVSVYQFIAYVYGNDYQSGFYNDTSLFGTLASRYTNLKLVEEDGTDFTLSLPRASAEGSDRNTNIDVTATASGPWSGSVTLEYDRLNLEDLIPDPYVSDPSFVDGATSHQLLPQISNFLGLKVIENDLVNTTFTNGNIALTVSPTSRSFLEGPDVIIGQAVRDMSLMFYDQLLPGFKAATPMASNTKSLIHFNDGSLGTPISDAVGGTAVGTNIITVADGQWPPFACAELEGTHHESYIDITPIDKMTDVGHAIAFECWMATINGATQFEGTFLHTLKNYQIKFGQSNRAFYSGFSSNYLTSSETFGWPTVVPGKFYHVKVVIEQQYWAIYIDGKRVCYTTSPYAIDFINKDKAAYRLGNVFPTGNIIGQQLKCRIDEFRIIEQPSSRNTTINVPYEPFHF